MQIEARNISHIYNPGLSYQTNALNNVSLSLNSNEMVCLIGHTGSGKTTLVQHLCGLLKPDAGKILADGVDINEKSDGARKLKRKIGIVFQYPEYQLFEETIIKDVCFGPLNLGFSQEEALKKAEKALTLVGMDAKAIGEKSPFALSGGQKRRVAIAGILAMEPEFLILDEPAAGLDPVGKNLILQCILNIQKERKIGILLISHNMDDVAEIAQRVLVMDKGNLVMDASPKEVFANKTKLREMGLSAPPASEFMEKLKEKGFDLEENCISLEEAEKEILKLF